jgi:hypothetical protein
VGIYRRTYQEESYRMKLAAVAVLAAALVAPAAAQGATMTVDPAQACYRETETVFLPASGFTPNALVDFSRDGSSLGQVPADASGGLTGELTLPNLSAGEEQLTYLATDTANPANTAQVSLLVTATDVDINPLQGKPNRLRTIKARGFFGGGKRLYAHVVRSGRRASTARHVKIGRVKGACKKVRAQKRLFPAGAAFGTYTVQFDTFRAFKRDRAVKSTYSVNIFPTTRGAAAAAETWRRIG